MMYFWLIPVVLLVALVVWLLYASSTKSAPGRTEGRTVLDKGTPDRTPGGS